MLQNTNIKLLNQLDSSQISMNQQTSQINQLSQITNDITKYVLYTLYISPL